MTKKKTKYGRSGVEEEMRAPVPLTRPVSEYVCVRLDALDMYVTQDGCESWLCSEARCPATFLEAIEDYLFNLRRYPKMNGKMMMPQKTYAPNAFTFLLVNGLIFT